MITQILIHILPHEIDQLERILIQLKKNSKYIPSNHSIITDVILNTNLTNWEKSILPKEFFITKFQQLEQLTKTWSITNFKIDNTGEILGCVSHRRKAFRETQADNVLILDTDVFFSDSFLYHLITGASLINEKQSYYILTPQITKMWDNSWDCLVHSDFIKDSTDAFKLKDPYITSDCLKEVNVKSIDGFKFGGGWGTLISKSLLKKIDIPDSLGHYGLEDTFIMIGSSFLKRKGINVTQFILENEILIEDNKFRYSPYKEYLSFIDRREEFKKIANENFQIELNKFENSL